MEQKEENQQCSSPISVLSRLDRLDRLVRYLEDKQIMSRRESTAMTLDNQCKPLSTALDELHIKGTLMERVAMLEKSVLQLSLDMEEWNTSNSNSSSNSTTIVVHEDVSHDFPAKQYLLGALNEKRDNVGMQESSFEEPPRASKRQSYKKSRTMSTTLLRRNWLGCFQTNTLNPQ